MEIDKGMFDEERKSSLLFVIVFQVLVVFGLLELGIRIVQHFHRPTSILLYSSTAETRYQEDKTLEELLDRHFKGFQPYKEIFGFVSNSKSFRTKEYSRNKPPNTFRILALGDSFTYASGGVPHYYHWTTKLERDLSARIPEEVELLNLGWPGVGPKFQLRLWELEAGHLQADLVVFAFFVGNDFVEDLRKSLSVEHGLLETSLVVRALRNLYRLRGGAVEETPTQAHDYGRPVDSKSTLGYPKGGYEIESYRTKYDPLKPSFSEERFFDVETKRMALCLRTEAERFDQLFDMTANTLLVLREQVTSSGADFVVMIIPDEYQVNKTVTTEVLDRTNRSISDYDLSLPQRRLAEFFGRSGINYVDLLPAFEEAGRNELLYKLRNTHWNIAGNSLAAVLLVERLSRIKLLPRDAQRRTWSKNTNE